MFIDARQRTAALRQEGHVTMDTPRSTWPPNGTEGIDARTSFYNISVLSEPFLCLTCSSDTPKLSL